MAYSDMYDGLRSYYERVGGGRVPPAYNAAMTLSFLFCMNLGAAITLGDYLVNGNQNLSIWFFGHTMLLLLLGVGVAWLHVVFGKMTGIYGRAGPSRSPRWKSALSVYAGASGALFLAAIAAAFVIHR